jgi:mannose-6-phosphate isomerase-like protein (cupin superfamily)
MDIGEVARRSGVPASTLRFILQGQAVLEVDGSSFELGAGQVLEVPPGARHQFRNESTARL